jgi:uncharacterized membrane protein YfcA
VSVSAAALLFGAAFLAGALNSVAGGGSFISFPALLFAGVSPVVASATNTVGVWPASVASAYAYRDDLRQPRAVVVSLGVAGLVGGVLGALLLLRTRETTFVHLIPWLLLGASAVFTAGGRAAAKLRARGAHEVSRAALVAATAFQLVISIYGGYFGAGMGILMLAAFALMGMTNMHAMNGLKTILATLVNGVAVVAFIVAGAVAWGPAVVMLVGSTAGGFLGAKLARNVTPESVRKLVLVVAWGMTVYFFVKTYAKI